MAIDLADALAKAGIGDDDYFPTKRVMLDPGLPDCPIELDWKVLPASKLAAVTGSKRIERIKGVEEKDIALAEALAKNCLVGVHGIDRSCITDWDLFPTFSDEKIDALAEVIGDDELGVSEESRLLLCRKSQPFRAALLRLQDVSAVNEAEAALRKKASAPTSDTAN